MNNIILFGFMGTGKSTIGKLLNKKLGLSYIDMDSYITSTTGKSIKQIFDEDGEPFFRKLERELVQKLSLLNNQIISTGGGVVLDKKNISDFTKNGLAVCLNASPEIIFERIKNDNTRPLLSKINIDIISNLLKERSELYDKISFQIKTDHMLPETISSLIIENYKKYLELN